jgi:hypothetical protein
VSESLGHELAGWVSSLPAVPSVGEKASIVEGETVSPLAMAGASDVDLMSKQQDGSTPAPVSMAVPETGSKGGGGSRTSRTTSKRYEVVEDDRGMGSVVEAPAAPAPALPAARADVYLGQQNTKPALPAARADVYQGQQAADAKKVVTPAGGTARRGRIGGNVE